MLTETVIIIMASANSIVAMLYASVGHGGASGYIAVMALFSVAPTIIKPSVLILNIAVSLVAFSIYATAGHFRWRFFWPFAVTSIPASFTGGLIPLPPHVFKLFLGIALLCSAARILFSSFEKNAPERTFHIPWAMLSGALIGLVSGITGVGGGIFLSPLILMLGWAGQRETSAVSALFILVNSIAGLAGYMSATPMATGITSLVPLLLTAALSGGIVGGVAGSRVLTSNAIARALTIVVGIAGVKMIVI